jgi:membrane protease YdiL (CAAX protease family)
VVSARRGGWLPVAVFVVVVVSAMNGFGLMGRPALAILGIPSLVAVVLCVLLPRRWSSLADLGIHRLGARRLAVAVLTGAGGTVLGVVAITATGLAHLPPAGGLLLPIGAWHLLGGLRQGILEEFGWRGFLQVRLTRLAGARTAVVLTGLSWAAFHYGLVVTSGPPHGLPLPVHLAILTTTLVGVSAFAGYLYLVTGSAWPAVALHAANNIVSDYVDRVIGFGSPGTMAEAVGELVGLAFWTVLAAWAWRRLEVRSASGSAVV